jgi:ubiquinone/menaquinone biosynthesis C-methylase UbiE
MTNTNRFTGLAKIYAQARPSYPKQAIENIVSHCKLNANSILVDIGSGTGISSRLFAKYVFKVIGIEPNEDMRNEAKSNIENNNEYSNIEYMDGTAEQTGLADTSVDAIICAQAFHWFNPEIAMLEFKRILKNDGWVVLLWNERDENDKFTAEYGNLIRKLPETKSVEVPRGKSGLALLTSNLFCKQEKTIFANEQILNKEKLLARAFSASYVPKTGKLAESFKNELIALFHKYQKDDSIVLKYETAVYFACKNK